MTTSARSANLRALLADDEDARQTVSEMIVVMESIEKEDIRGFRLASLLDPGLPEFVVNTRMKPFQLDGEILRSLRKLVHCTSQGLQLTMPTEALSVEEISLRGVCYSMSRSSNFRSSRIIFCLPGHNNTQKAGVIRDIFQYTYQFAREERRTFYLSVQEFHRIKPKDGQRDPYLEHGFAGGFLCEAIPAQLHVLELSQVVSHFGLTKMTGEYKQIIHVMPLDRVRSIFRIGN